MPQLSYSIGYSWRFHLIQQMAQCFNHLNYSIHCFVVHALLRQREKLSLSKFNIIRFVGTLRVAPHSEGRYQLGCDSPLDVQPSSLWKRVDQILKTEGTETDKAKEIRCSSLN